MLWILSKGRIKNIFYTAIKNVFLRWTHAFLKIIQDKNIKLTTYNEKGNTCIESISLL